MSGIIWLLYAADVASSVSTALTLISVFGFIGCGCYIIGCAATLERFKRPPYWFMGMLLGCAAVASLIPGKATIYAIAAAQAGEKALATDTGDKAVRALNAWLDRQIAGEKEAK